MLQGGFLGDVFPSEDFFLQVLGHNFFSHSRTVSGIMEINADAVWMGSRVTESHHLIPNFAKNNSSRRFEPCAVHKAMRR